MTGSKEIGRIGQRRYGGIIYAEKGTYHFILSLYKRQNYNRSSFHKICSHWHTAPSYL